MTAHLTGSLPRLAAVWAIRPPVLLSLAGQQHSPLGGAVPGGSCAPNS